MKLTNLALSKITIDRLAEKTDRMIEKVKENLKKLDEIIRITNKGLK